MAKTGQLSADYSPLMSSQCVLDADGKSIAQNYVFVYIKSWLDGYFLKA